MLAHISIKDFTIVDSLELDLSSGFSAVTGETGAGKSIMLDALSLATGGKAEASHVRPGANKAEIYACFELHNKPKLQAWLDDNDMTGDQDQLILSRIITGEGRSRGYINGRPAPLQQLKEVGNQLLDIHGQHAHQVLLHKDSPRNLLDDYGKYSDLLDTVKTSFEKWQDLKKRVNCLQNQSDDALARIQLLEYQVQELDALDLQTDEVEALELDQKRLANAETHLLSAQQALFLCKNDDDQGDAHQAIQQSLQKLDPFIDSSPSLASAHELLNQAYLVMSEASDELGRYIDNFEVDPLQLQNVEERLNAIYELARKHKVRPEELTLLHEQLADELKQLKGQDQSLDELIIALEQAEQDYSGHSQALSSARNKAAEKLRSALLKQLKQLALDKAQVKFEIHSQPIHKATKHGMDTIQLLVSFNPGQALQPLQKVASGGELSRISLALQILIQKGPATLIFDEIDVGVGGATAERMGRLLKQLGEHKQVISVTHQPQVASLAHQHLLVNKLSGKQQTRTQIRTLSPEQRQQELARMLGGLEITDLTLAHAKDMLMAAQA
ncbi:DNA repair protein RecN [Oceaniserpentilla sp. 4NH20-0058]|uniref:DNA repair protein RecN n=1 Tax=Oceaniserpentilla sp. 4NH20-0058 TaxID=3127660 RepID=UPI00310213B8